MAEKKQSFETALAELEQIVAAMESGELPLDEMMAKFEAGRARVAQCTAELESIRRRIEKVVSTDPHRTESLEET